MKADLHMHSTYSDGLKTTKELFQTAKKNGVDMIAITDHDVVKGVEENYEYSKLYGVDYLPGIELSTVEQGKPVHVLGYFKDDSYYSEEFKKYYIEIREARESRARKMIFNIEKFFSLKITYEEVLGYSRGIIARPHIAKAITNNYPQYDHNYIFEHFIGDHAKAYVPTCELSVQEGVDLLRRNNCVVVLAHPTLLKPHIKDTVLDHDFDGIEARYYQNKEGEEELFRNLALKRDLIVTAGSDHHGIPNDSKHGEIGDLFIEKEDLKHFLNALKK